MEEAAEELYQKYIKETLDLILKNPNGTSRKNTISIPNVEVKKEDEKEELLSNINPGLYDRLIHDPRYKFMLNVHNGYFVIERSDGKKTLFDIAGNQILKKWYDFVHDVHDGYALVYDGEDRYFYVDTKGNEYCKGLYKEKEIKDFKGGFALVRNKDYKYNVIDTSLREIGKEWFDEIYDFSEGYFRVRKGGKYNFLGLDGNLLFKEWHKGIVGDMHDGYAVVLIDQGKYNYIGKDEKFIRDEAFPYWLVLDFCNGFAEVSRYKNRNMYGSESNFIDKKGNLISPKWYSRVFNFSKGGTACVEIGRKYAYIDVKGNIFIEAERINEICANSCFTRYWLGETNKYQTFYWKKDLKDYTAKKILRGYQCFKDKEKFNVKYEPVKIFNDQFILCVDENKAYLYNRKVNKYLDLGTIDGVEYTDELLRVGRVIYLIYDGKMMDITKYYNSELKDKENYYITDGVKLLTRETFFSGNEEDIKKRFNELKVEQERIKAKQKKDNENRQLEELQALDKIELEKEKIDMSEAIYQITKALEKLNRLSVKHGRVLKIKVDSLFINVDRYKNIDRHKEFNPKYLNNGLLNYADFSGETFENVKVSGMDLSQYNIDSLIPGKVFNKDLSNCNLEGIFFPVSTDFTGVNICGARFTNDGRVTTFDINEETLAKGIYDETTLLNGVPLVELLPEKEEKNTKQKN